MPIQFNCSCGHQFKTQSANAGKSIVCPTCDKKQKVPAEDVAESASMKAVAGKSARSAVAAHEPEPVDTVDVPHKKLPTLPPKPKKRGGADAAVAPIEIIKKPEGPQHASKNAVIGIIATVVVLMIGGGVVGFFALQNSGGGSGAALQVTYKPVRNEAASLGWQVPDSWTSVTGGGTGGVPASMSCEDGTARIAFMMTPSGSAVGDMSKAGDQQNTADLPLDLQPAGKVHDFMKKHAEEKYTNYKEVDQPQKLNCALGDARISKFTADGGWGSRRAGYRCTVLTLDTYTVYADCPIKQFKRYEPIFRTVVESIGR